MNVRVDGIREAIAAATLAGQPQARQWMQQAVNRQGTLEVGRSVRELRGPLPVKAKYLRARVKWRRLGKDGSGGVLRFLGAGRFRGSGFLRPRHAKLKYPTLAPVRNRGQFVRSGAGLRKKSDVLAVRRSAAVSYGVGGLIPRKSVLRGFVMSVQEGPLFRQAWQSGFVSSRAQVFSRDGKKRLPVSKEAGPTVGTAAKSIGLPEAAGQRIADRAITDFQARLEREAKSASRGSLRGGGG